MNIRDIPSFIMGAGSGMFTKPQYMIKPGYRHRKKYIHYDDRAATDESQKEVYQEALRVMRENNFQRIVDYGCGSAFKLVNNFNEFQTVGVEVSPTFEFLSEKYPDREWHNGENLEHNKLSADLVICADVIEHVMDPDSFLQRLLLISDVKYYIISTPDRDTVRGKLDYGPPANKHHIREWNLFEFRRYMEQFFDIKEHKLVNVIQSNQLILGTKKQ